MFDSKKGNDFNRGYIGDFNGGREVEQNPPTFGEAEIGKEGFWLPKLPSSTFPDF